MSPTPSATPATTPEPSLPDLTVRQLEYLDAVSRAPTWARAAEGLGVTPSALSQGLAELERRVGVALFERHGRRRLPTQEAAEVLDHARRVLAQTRDLARWAASAREGRAGRLRIGMIDAAAVDHFPDALRAFRDERPDLELHLVVAPSAALLDQLADGALDLAVCVAPREVDPAGARSPRSDRPDLELTALVDEPLAAYAPPGTRTGPPATWGPWVTFPTGSHTRRRLAEALGDLGAPFEVVAESHQPEVLREMVRLGLGWTVLPVAQAERPPQPLERARRRPVTTRTLVAARRADALPDPAVDALLTTLTTA